MRLVVTGGSGVLGRAAIPHLRCAGHAVAAPTVEELDLFDPDAVLAALEGSDAVLHLATRIPPPERQHEPGAWVENDRLRVDASRLLVDAALRAGTASYVQPSVTFVYPDGPADEATPLDEVAPHIRSALVAESEAGRFAGAGRRGVVLRLGLLDGPGTANACRNPRYGATLAVADAGRALVASLRLQSGVYNVCRDDERVSNERFKASSGWGPSA